MAPTTGTIIIREREPGLQKWWIWQKLWATPKRAAPAAEKRRGADGDRHGSRQRPGCFKCGQPGHVARNCPGQAQRQAMMAGDSPGSKPVIGSQRPPNRVGFDVSHQSVQRPATTRRTMTRTEKQNCDELLAQASINLPLEKFSKLPGMPNRVTSFVKGAQPMSTLAQKAQKLENTTEPTEYRICHYAADARARLPE